tara:strand:- start:127 stop:516 length:390 start_codon:yes stop_codon:yes gene_type:complete
MRLFILLGLIGLFVGSGCAMRSHSLSGNTVDVDKGEILTVLYVADYRFFQATESIIVKYSLPKLKRLCNEYPPPSSNFRQFQISCKQLLRTPLKGGSYERTARMLLILQRMMRRVGSNFNGTYIHPSEQ